MSLPGAVAQRGQLLAGVVTGVHNGQVFLDVGQEHDAYFRSRSSGHRFRKGDVLFCEVADFRVRSGRVTLKEPVNSNLTAGLRWRAKEDAAGPRHAALDQAGGKALSSVKVGSQVDGTITGITDDHVFVDFGAGRYGTVLAANKVEMYGFRIGDLLRRLKVVGIQPKWGVAALEMPEPDDADVAARIERDWGKCLALYVHGSTIFSNKPPSDVDLLAVVDEPALRPIRTDTTSSQFKLGRYEVSVYPRSAWLRKMAEMDLTMVTCSSLPDRFVLRELDPELRFVRVCPTKLHESILSYAEFTWVKAHFMLEHKVDVYRSSKNVYFVIRLLELGRQLLEHGRIVDLQAANPWWEHVRELYEQLSVEPGDWNLVEAALAGDVRRHFVRFHETLGKALWTLLPRRLPAPLAHKVSEFLCARPSVCQLVPSGPAPEHVRDLATTCSLCSEPLSAGPALALVRCGHSFHRSCTAERLRLDRCAARHAGSSGWGGEALPPPRSPTCWECGFPLQLGLDEDVLLARCGGGAPGPVFAGYPATQLLPEELDCKQLDAASAQQLLRRLMV